jgi:hypothetical protein
MTKSGHSFRQSQRLITAEEIVLIQQTFEQFSFLSETELVGTVCEHLNWFTASGLPKDTACKLLFHQMQEKGLIRIPPKRGKGSVRKAPPKETPQTAPQPPLEVTLKSIAPVALIPVTTDKERHLWNEYVERYHPLGYKKPAGYALRYFIRTKDTYLGCLLVSGAARAIDARDKWIGWRPEQRKANLPWVVNNARYLIFPWVKIPHLASHVLGQLARRVADDWDERWGFRPLLLETFVDPIYYSGVCYQAAGWECLGETTGRGLAQPGKTYKSSPKLIFVKPLTEQSQSLLCSTLKGRTEL